MKPRAFLSYRHNFQPEIEGREALIRLITEQQKLHLIFDKSVTNLGDSVTDFMEELISARCIYLFITEEYFKSAYTLFELIAINEHEEADKKIILPVCMSEQVLGVYDYTDIKAHWDIHQETRDILAQLLNVSGRSRGTDQSSDLIWNRVLDAWEKIVFPYLNTLRDINAPFDMDALITQVVDESTQKALDETERTQARDRSLILDEITFLLDAQPLIRENLIKASRSLRRLGNVDNKEFAKRFLSDAGEAALSLGELTNAGRQIRDTLGKHSAEWCDLFQDVQQLCGCLLLNTIEPAWWFNHQLELRRQAQNCVTGSGYTLDHPAFVEVVISKELLSRGQLHSPKFSPDPRGTGSVVPGRGTADEDYNNLLMFDAVNVNAVAHHLLANIHNDLHHSTTVPDDVSELMREIKDRAIAYKNASDQRPVYYIVGHDYLEQLKSQDWFPNFETSLKGSLQFICCSKETLVGSGQATVESQTQLLSAVRHLLDLNRE